MLRLTQPSKPDAGTAGRIDAETKVLVAICIGIPGLLLGLIAFMRCRYGDEVFSLGWPTHELNRTEDYRLIKMRLESAAMVSDVQAGSQPCPLRRPESERS